MNKKPRKKTGSWIGGKKPSGSNSWLEYAAEALAKIGALVVVYRITTKHIEDHNITGKDVVAMGESRARRVGQIVEIYRKLKTTKGKHYG